MITLLAILGGLGFLGLVIASVLYLLDAPSRTERIRIELEAQSAAWQLHQHLRQGFQSMLEETRSQLRPDADR